MTDNVKKIPYSIEAATQNFDITKPQPQLFVTPDFAYLSLVLDEFANTMALRKGGLKGVEKLIDSKNIGTIELTTGLQISGNFDRVIATEDGKVAYVQTKGYTALANRDKELIGHGINVHQDGFGSPIGKLKGINLPIEDMSPRDLKAYGIYEGEFMTLEFESGVVLKGRAVTGTRDLRGKILLITFDECTVTYKDEVLFQPEWGLYDMAVGKDVISAYAGPADVDSFDDLGKVSETKTHKIQYSNSEKELYGLYQEIREMREQSNASEVKISTVLDRLNKDFPEDWLLCLELYELALKNQFSIQDELIKRLKELKSNKSYTKLIDNGLVLCRN
jgi:phenylalanine-4-hydroxylase